ncbi:HAD family phosphatase [Oceanobacillus piezotolerans]|uniref:HAD family phosphatase n=1 Tax=Oceanobacillus piezotolerans TaxID=2448030 RepID=A0A498DDL2_9BACI|nr:HAD family hydrolase [Oceanobacillus piezotolerans]RLL46750.1 HAD family phosphatase [Oceanobacillus piezotolerans]
MTYKVLFLDIDGTILKPDHTYAQSTRDAILQVQKQGIEVFIATGRPIHEIRELAEELNIDSFIGYNGALALFNEETIVDEPMHEETVKKMVQLALQHNHEVIMYTNGKNYLTNPESSISKHFAEAFQMTKNHPYTYEVAGQILGMTIMNLEPEDSALYQFDPTIRLSQVNVEGVKHAYDIIRTSVNKGEAIKKLLERLNIEKEEAIAFGDGMNDKEMLQAAGASFAMGNAADELEQYAKHQTTSVNEDGIFNGLKKLGLVK